MKNEKNLKNFFLNFFHPRFSLGHPNMHIGSFFQKSLLILECLLFGAGEIWIVMPLFFNFFHPRYSLGHPKMHIGSFFQKSLHILECLLFGAGEFWIVMPLYLDFFIWTSWTYLLLCIISFRILPTVHSNTTVVNKSLDHFKTPQINIFQSCDVTFVSK